MPNSWFPKNGISHRILSTAVAITLVFTVVVIVPSFGSPAEAVTKISLEQCANGSAATPSDPCTWQNGNLNANQAHLIEGYSAPYRAIMTDLPTAVSITVRVGYDTKDSSKHALDYLTSYQRYEPHEGFEHLPEAVQPLDGISGVSSTSDTHAIPAPGSVGTPQPGQPTADFNSLPAGEREFTLFGGTISNISYFSEEDISGASAETTIDITFTADSTTAVLAWGGHIATQSIWGEGAAAGNLNGSPYHMRLKQWDFGAGPVTIGRQDRSLSASSVFPTGTVIIHKEAIGGDDTFDFTATGTGMSDFSLDTAQTTTKTFTGILAGDGNGDPHLTKTVTEDLSTLPSGWSFTGLRCEEDKDQNTTTAREVATIQLDPNETVECWYTNEKVPNLTLVKVVTNNSGGTIEAIDWTLAATGTSGSFSEQAQGTADMASVGPKDVVAGVTYTLSESGPDGYAASDWVCVDADNWDANLSNQVTLASGDSAECTITNDDRPVSIEIEKATNTHDADLAPGPYISVGSTVNWAYVVTNTGDVALNNVAVVDDQGVTVGCPSSTLAAGASMTCTASGVATAGQYANLGTATATAVTGAPVSDTDPSHYFGVLGDLELEKHTNTVDADTPTGPYIPVGGDVTWDFIVTNGSNATISDIAVTDDKLGAISCPGTSLASGVSMTCTTNGTAIIGQYVNLGSVTGIDMAGSRVGDVDPSHYFGLDVGIHIEKWTNGQDADKPTGPYILAGDAVNWEYRVTNPGNTEITNVVVTDDQGETPVFMSGDVDNDGKLDPGELWIYTADGVATAGQYANIGTVTGDATGNGQVTDTDPSHYFGMAPSIDIEKATNGEDADTPFGPSIIAGDAVTWTYVVTNDGNIDLVDVAVTDDMGVIPLYVSGDNGDDGVLSVGEVWTYEATGLATPGQYANIGTATGTPVVATPATQQLSVQNASDSVTDSDPSHYFGAQVLRSATIGDFVWNDENGDGIQDADEKGIAGAKVLLTLPDSTTMEAVTNASGLYLFSGLDAGSYKAELILSSIPSPAEGSNKITTASSYTIELAEGESFLTADFGVTAELPKTGASADEIGLIALALLVAGGLALFATRRREDDPGKGDIAA